MTSGIRLIRSLLLGVCFQALVGCVFGPTAAAAVPQVPPVQAGTARVWFLRQFSPGESLATPIISANGAPVYLSLPVLPSCTIFHLEPTPSRCRASGSIPVRRQPCSWLRGRRPISRSNHCAAGRAQAATPSSVTLSMYGLFQRFWSRNIFSTSNIWGHADAHVARPGPRDRQWI
jgi:hypothetical protein